MDNALDSRVQRLIDKDEIHAVIMRYARGVDRCDAEMIDGCYHDDAIDDHGDFILKAEDCADVFTTMVGRGRFGGMHLIGNCLVEIESETVAFAESYFLAIKDTDLPPQGVRHLRIRAGRYLDRFEKRQGHWKIAQRAVVDEWNQLNEIQNRLGGPDRFRFGTKNRDDLVYKIKEGSVVRENINAASEVKSRQRS